MTTLQRAQKLAESLSWNGKADAVRRILNWLVTDKDPVAKCLGIVRALSSLPADEQDAVLAMAEHALDG